MNIGHRVFVVQDDDSIISISQKTFNDFYIREKPVLCQYAGRSVTFAVVLYELENRKPKRIIRIDTQRLRVGDDGGLDKEFKHEYGRLVANRIGGFTTTASSAEFNSGPVVEAASKFDQRRWAHLHPEVSGPALKRILSALFGARRKS